MPSTFRSEAARRNGAKSRGPVTEAGKQTSSGNATKHGLHSSAVVLNMEDPEQYHRLLASYLDELRPVGPVEEALVMDMVNARWRLQRLQQLETVMLDLQSDAILEDPDLPGDARTDQVSGRAYQILIDKSRALSHLQRQEGRLTRVFHRSHALLRELQAERKSTQPDPATPTKPKKDENEPKAAKPMPIQQFTPQRFMRDMQLLTRLPAAPEEPDAGSGLVGNLHDAMRPETDRDRSQ